METKRNARSLKPKVRLQLDDYITSVTWTRDSSHVVAGTAAGTLVWVDAITLQIVHQIHAHSLGVSRVMRTSERRQVYSGGQDGKLKAWTAGRELPDLDLTLGKNWVEHLVAGGRSEQSILAVAEGRNVRFFNKAGLESRPKAEMTSTVTGLAWHYLGQQLLVAAYGGLQVYGVKKGTPQALKKYDWKGAFWCCAWSPDGKWVAGATQEKAVHIWDAETSEHLHMPGYPGKVKFMGWTRDAKWLVTAAGLDLLLWDCSGKGPCGRAPRLLAAHGSSITVCSVQQEGNLFASGDEGGRMILWDVSQEGEAALIAAFSGETEFSAGSWSQDDQVLALGTADGGLYLF
jgi:WD40 repeat protein